MRNYTNFDQSKLSLLPLYQGTHNMDISKVLPLTAPAASAIISGANHKQTMPALHKLVTTS